MVAAQGMVEKCPEHVTGAHNQRIVGMSDGWRYDQSAVAAVEVMAVATARPEKQQQQEQK